MQQFYPEADSGGDGLEAQSHLRMFLGFLYDKTAWKLLITTLYMNPCQITEKPVFNPPL